MDCARIHHANETSNGLYRILWAVDVDRCLAVRHHRFITVHRSDEATDVGRAYRIDITARHEGAVDLAIVNAAKQTVVEALVATVTIADVGDVHIVDEMALAVECSTKLLASCLHGTNRHPNIRLQVEVGRLLDVYIRKR